MRMRVVTTLAGLALVGGAGCASDECNLEEANACGEERVCEVVAGQEKGRCFAPVQLEGRVFDLQEETAIAGAEVTAVDENGAPVANVASTDAEGHFVLRVPTPRSDEKGTYTGRKVTLRAAAGDYEPFPAGIRPSLPIDTKDAAQEKDGAPWVVAGPLTEVGLFPLPANQQGLPRVTGSAGAAGAGALVVAEPEAGGAAISTAVADSTGAFTLFNVRSGTWKVSAFRQGVAFSPASVTVAEEDVADVVLEKREGGVAKVTGSISLVSGGSPTSVVLAVESTFNDALLRGQIPYGLRAPNPGEAPSLSGAFTIEGVPAGRYVVLAGFENDGSVRDPDEGIAGTELQRIEVGESGEVAAGTFKVTDAIDLVGPGAEQAVEQVGGTPVFQWLPYPSAQKYDLSVLDAQGREVWVQKDMELASSGTLEVPYGGPALTPGGIYQWRLKVWGNKGTVISLSEDLKGVFQLAEP